MAGERRKHQRFNLVGDTVAAASITSSAPDFVMAAKVTDIGVVGLALTHYSCKLPQYSSLELGIVLPGETLKISNLTGESIWDQDTKSQLPARRCGMRFRNLTHDQKASLQYLIRNYTTKGAEP
jgi:hypothetical protein